MRGKSRILDGCGFFDHSGGFQRLHRMRFLADTHAFLWYIFDDPRLSDRAERAFNDQSEVLFSLASLWEIVVKVSIGKLKLGCEYKKFVEEYVLKREVELLSIDLPHLANYASLPLHHRDPFDRLLIAQAR